MKRNAMVWMGLGLLALTAAPPLLADKSFSPQARFAKVDANGDGFISRAEHAGFGRDHYQKMDGNGDGYLTVSEISALHDEWRGTQPKGWKEGPADKVKQMDGNGDGRVSATEHAAYKAQLFDDWDSDHDGMLTEPEFTAGMRVKMSR